MGVVEKSIRKEVSPALDNDDALIFENTKATNL